jgi:hypothetical protein
MEPDSEGPPAGPVEPLLYVGQVLPALGVKLSVEVVGKARLRPKEGPVPKPQGDALVPFLADRGDRPENLATAA